MSFEMTCEYCNVLWKEGHACVASELAAKIAPLVAELAGLKVLLQCAMKHAEKRTGEIAALKAKLEVAVAAFKRISSEEPNWPPTVAIEALARIEELGRER